MRKSPVSPQPIDSLAERFANIPIDGGAEERFDDLEVSESEVSNGRDDDQQSSSVAPIQRNVVSGRVVSGWDQVRVEQNGQDDVTDPTRHIRVIGHRFNDDVVQGFQVMAQHPPARLPPFRRKEILVHGLGGNELVRPLL